jgi:osmoprotectant transport system permease protein
MDGVIAFFLDPANWTGTTGIPNRLLEHLVISVVAIVVAALIAIPVGLYIGHTNRGASFAINFANVGRAIPSYAMMVIPLPLIFILAPIIGFDPTFGLTTLPILIAMIFLAVPPLLLSTFAGLRAVDDDLVESGRGMGMRERQILTDIELPIASSIIVGGFRTATLQVIATATIGAILAGGGLGRFIFDGLNQGLAGRTSIFVGAILVTSLALVVDFLLSVLQTRLTPRALRRREATASKADLALPADAMPGVTDGSSA